MELEKIIFFRDFFFKAFIIGIVLSFISTMSAWVIFPEVLMLRDMEINNEGMVRIMFPIFFSTRIIVVFFFLVPAVTLHWVVKKKK